MSRRQGCCDRILVGYVPIIGGAFRDGTNCLEELVPIHQINAFLVYKLLNTYLKCSQMNGMRHTAHACMLSRKFDLRCFATRLQAVHHGVIVRGIVAVDGYDLVARARMSNHITFFQYRYVPDQLNHRAPRCPKPQKQGFRRNAAQLTLGSQ